MINILFQCTQDDIPYLGLLKGVLGGKANVAINSSTPVAIHEICIRAKEKGTKYVATTNPAILKLLCGSSKIDSYAGSVFERFGIEILIVDPVEHLITVTYGKHLYERYFRKFLAPSTWLQIPEFRWKLFEPAETESLLDLFSRASFIATDIETGPRNPEPEDERYITCISFTAIFLDYKNKSYTTSTVVIPFTDTYNLAVVRKILALPIPKIFQNGKYDNAYLLRYNCITINWAFDTINLFHSWYSELPKDLGFITSYLLRKWEYHKDESQTSDLNLYYQYNAKDSFTTALDFLALLTEMPPWALHNYILEFPLVFPCLLAEMTGIKCDEERRKDIKAKLDVNLDLQLARIRNMVACGNYNPSSPKQTLVLFSILGCGDLKGTGKIQTDKAKARHPLNKRILSAIETYRKNRKSVSSYFKDSAVWRGRIMYAINPHGTDTARMASKESHFWCGLQIQNIPRENTNKEAIVKEMFITDEEFLFGEADYSQAETWGTAYLSGDAELLRVIHDPSKDFHSYNASAFFGLEYTDICESTFDSETGEWTHNRLNKDIIDIAKRNNHGSNYNMGAAVLLDTMGIENVVKAQKLLRLPLSWSLIKVTDHILSTFAKTYPGIKGPWYDKCKNDVKGTGFLISPFGWYRYCFGDPTKSKLALNSYVAHPPQNLNAGMLSKAWLRVFKEVALPNVGNFKLCAQIHDCILFQYRKGFEDLAWKVKQIMEETSVPVTDVFGVTRILKVPVDLKGGSTRWSDAKKLKKLAA